MIRCGRCNTPLDSQGRRIYWKPENWLCKDCEEKWEKIFFKQASIEIKNEVMDKLWQEFVSSLLYNPSSRYSN